MSEHSLLSWSEHFQLQGHQDLDQQHHQLFELVNQLCELINRGGNIDSIITLTRSLLAHTVRHFADEERLFYRLPRNERSLHLLHHKHYLEALSAFLERLDSGVNMSAESMNNQLRSLADWYQSHVLHSDSKLVTNC
jgi:hemerythrin